MKITWVLPRDFGRGIGGYAIVYGYANQLAARGHRVTVLHVDPAPWRNRHAMKGWLRRSTRKPCGEYEPSVDVRRFTVPFLSRRLLRGQDAVVATAWQTAEMVAKLNLGLRGFYFIQHHETWAGEESRVNATWRLPLTRVVIASWLEDVARNLGALPVTVIPNAIDIEKFCVVKPVDQRPAARVAMLWHGATWKRSADGLTALKMAQQEVPELSAVMFSRLERPIDMPDWVEWHHDATSAKVAEIMNSASIFLTPSEAEGWALPPAEALACGCALVATNIGGHHDYAIADRTAVLVPVGDTDSMASAIVQLVSNDRLRVGLGTSGANLMRDEFSWAASTDRLLLVLTSAAGLASAK